MSEINKAGVPVTGVWLRTDGPWMEVLAEMDGQWRVIIRTYAPLNEQTISHIVEPLGMLQSPRWGETV